MTIEKATELRKKLYKKCLTCEHFGPNFGICFRQETMTNRRGICNYYEALNVDELSEYTEKELKEGQFFTF